MNVDEFVDKNKILECVAGSHAYGFSTPTSDLDVRGITVPPIDFVLGLHSFDQREYSETDKVIYGLKKFMQLAMDCNPNIIELLYTPKKHTIFIDEWGEMLVAHAHLFLSKKAKFTFSGYAIAQLKRIKRHKRWLDNPVAQPNPIDFQFVRYMTLRERDGKFMPTKVNEQLYNEFDGAKWKEEGIMSEYETALREYKSYQQWLENRNATRHDLESKFNYDTKHASHLVRLLRMGKEILEEGKVYVDRTEVGDAQDFRDIRNGSMTYEEILAYAESMDKELNELYEVKNELQHTINKDKINRLYLDIVCGKLGIKF